MPKGQLATVSGQLINFEILRRPRRVKCGAPKQDRRRDKTPAELFDSAGACEACGAVRILRVYFPELGCPSFSKKSNKSLMAGLFFGT